jgi:hypothetical protein
MPGAFGGTLLKSAMNPPAAGKSRMAAPSLSTGRSYSAAGSSYGPTSSTDDWEEDAALARRLQDEEQTASYSGVARDDDASLALALRLQDEDEAASLGAGWDRPHAEEDPSGWDQENLSLARRIHANEDAALRLQEVDRQRIQEEDEAALGQVTERDRRAQERRLRQLTTQTRCLSWARALSRSGMPRKPDTPNAPSSRSHQDAKFSALGGIGEPPASRLASVSLQSHLSSSASSTPLWQEAYRLVEQLQSSEQYAHRQQAAHQLSSTLARLHASAPLDALELLRHIEAVGKTMDAPLVLSLLELAVEAAEAQPTDSVTVQLVLSCLTNMSVGSGIEAILREGRAVQMIISWLVSADQRTREFSLACAYNLASTTERRLAHFRAVLLDSLASPGVQPSLKRAAREGTGQTAMHAQMMLNYKLERRAELARGARSSKEGTVASPLVDLTVGRAKDFDPAVNGPMSADATFVEAGSSDEEVDGAAADAMGRLRLSGRMRRPSGGYNLVLAVIAPDWAIDVSCIEHPEEPVVSAVATLPNPAHSALAATATFTCSSALALSSSSSLERLPRRQVSPPRRRGAILCTDGQAPSAAATERMGEAATETQADEEDSPLLGADTNSAVNATDDAAPVGITGLGLSSAPLSALASGRSSRRYSSVTTADY